MSDKKVKAQRAKILETVLAPSPTDPDFADRCPTLFDLLLPRWAENKQVRQGSKISVKADGSCWRVSIDCPTEGLATTILVPYMMDLWSYLEKEVSSGRSSWTPNYDAIKRARQGVEDLLP